MVVGRARALKNYSGKRRAKRERKREKGRGRIFFLALKLGGQRVQETTKCMRSLGVFSEFFFQKRREEDREVKQDKSSVDRVVRGEREGGKRRWGSKAEREKKKHQRQNLEKERGVFCILPSSILLLALSLALSFFSLSSSALAEQSCPRNSPPCREREKEAARAASKAALPSTRRQQRTKCLVAFVARRLLPSSAAAAAAASFSSSLRSSPPSPLSTRRGCSLSHMRLPRERRW